MITIANIITETEIKGLPKSFNQVKSISDIRNDQPILIIGWDIINTLYENVNILERKINNKIYWTFKKKEKRDLHEEDLLNFIEFSYNNIIKDIQYIFVDPIQYSLGKIKKILKKIKESKNNIGYKQNNMVYIYCNNLIFGIDLKLLKFMGFDIDKITLKIDKCTYVFLNSDDILIEYKEYIERLNNEVKYIPYLHSIKYGQNSTTSFLPIS